MSDDVPTAEDFASLVKLLRAVSVELFARMSMPMGATLSFVEREFLYGRGQDGQPAHWSTSPQLFARALLKLTEQSVGKMVEEPLNEHVKELNSSRAVPLRHYELSGASVWRPFPPKPDTPFSYTHEWRDMGVGGVGALLDAVALAQFRIVRGGGREAEQVVESSAREVFAACASPPKWVGGYCVIGDVNEKRERVQVSPDIWFLAADATCLGDGTDGGKKVRISLGDRLQQETAIAV